MLLDLLVLHILRGEGESRSSELTCLQWLVVVGVQTGGRLWRLAAAG